LRDSNLEGEALRPFFFESGVQRQQVIANRFVQVLTTFYKARDEWNDNEKAGGFVKVDDVSLNAPDQDDPAAVRLCEAVASLGPLAVKLGQTLSQRPDIVGKPACDALKRLQTQNVPFDDPLAYAILRESLDYWDGPLDKVD
jgi:predicted unusual protein kinase regulating ubiquinone biosynthesis (AarF/ABC1/UbiB family)